VWLLSVAVFLVLAAEVACNRNKPSSSDTLAQLTQVKLTQLLRQANTVRITVRGEDVPLRTQILERRDAINRMADALHVTAVETHTKPASCSFTVEVLVDDNRGFSIEGEATSLIASPDFNLDLTNTRGWYCVEVDPSFIATVQEELGSTFLEIYLSLCDEHDRLTSGSDLNSRKGPAAEERASPSVLGEAGTSPAEKQSP
jgi:hypothetical protein